MTTARSVGACAERATGKTRIDDQLTDKTVSDLRTSAQTLREPLAGFGWLSPLPFLGSANFLRCQLQDLNTIPINAKENGVPPNLTPLVRLSTTPLGLSTDNPSPVTVREATFPVPQSLGLMGDLPKSNSTPVAHPEGVGPNALPMPLPNADDPFNTVRTESGIFVVVYAGEHNTTEVATSPTCLRWLGFSDPLEQASSPLSLARPFDHLMVGLATDRVPPRLSMLYFFQASSPAAPQLAGPP